MGIAISEDTRAGDMTLADFRAFQFDRPDNERWELVAGVPIMMVPPKLIHNIIAGNLVGLLKSALRKHRPSLLPIQSSGLDLDSDTYSPEPDVSVIDRDYAIDQRYIQRGYLMAEIVSSSDEFFVPGRRARWIDVKRELYRAHAACEAILLIEQNRIAIDLDLRTATGWDSVTLTDPEARLSLPSFGLNCAISDLYEDTPLDPQSAD